MQKIIQADFNGQAMHFTADGWFNATDAAKKFGRRPNDWLALPETARYLEALERKYGKIPYFKTKRGGDTGKSGNAQGTWLHPKLAVRFAQWLDVDFAVWCDDQIDGLIRSEISTHRPATIPSASRDRAVLLHMAVDMVLFRGVGFGKAYSLLNAYAGTHHLAEMSLDQVEQTAQFAGRLMVGSDTRADWSRIAANNPDIDREFAQRGLPYAA
ncbi:KilA-N domain-containing protein [Aquitalea aquatica]|uniref:KilA-N domain-containing protein n=1 Tax=Aquitalea aquatica TaxID=3044273 RepID=A0A838Y4I1_9NEIS|nr:KilA-N domain-containing protein [Aquitalea magnusonii]MBA4707509.1 KilA-N domain-containing protein [Aquitalea magnusonii]